MIYVISGAYVLAFYALFMRLCSPLELRVFFSVYTVSTLYYGILGIWYWREIEKGSFVGANWYHELAQLPSIYMALHLLTGFFCLLLSPIFKKRSGICVKASSGTVGFGRPLDLVLHWMLGVGFLSSLLVILSGRGGGDDPASSNLGSFFQVFYILADLLIPVILFAFSTHLESKKFWRFALVFFLVYAVFTGLRYKIAIVAGAILLAYTFSRSTTNLRKGLAFASLACLLLCFSVLTITRVKFAGFDLERLDTQRIGYGFFADANSCFGLVATLSSYGNQLEFAGATPALEVFQHFVPRFLYPDKSLGSHLADIKYEIARTEESARSGTAVPFFGEYYAMYGWLGVLMGILFYVALTAGFLLMSRVNSVSAKQRLIGAGLVSSFMGYYYFSRGAMVQIAVSSTFIIAPYLLLLAMQSMSVSPWKMKLKNGRL